LARQPLLPSWSTFPHSAVLGLSGFMFSSHIRDRSVVTLPSIQKIVARISITRKNIERKKTKNSFSKNFCFPRSRAPRTPPYNQFTLTPRRNQTLIDPSPLARHRRTCYAISSRPLLQYRGPESSAPYPGPAGRPFPPQYDHST